MKFGICLVIVSWLLVISSAAQEVRQSESKAKITFCQHNSQYWQIWTMDLDGSNKKQLTNSKVDKRSPDFSSDGHRIVYTTNEGELWIMDSDGNNNIKIPLNISASEPRWCFNDSKITFTSYRGLSFLDDSDIWIIDSNGSNLKKIIRRPSLQFLAEVSKDGQEVLFVDVLEYSSHEVFKLNLEKNDYIQLTDNLFHDSAPVFSTDKSKIVYSCDKDANYDVWIMGDFGQNKRNLTHHPAFDSSPVITKDAKTIFFLSDRTKTTQIWSMDINGRNLKQITKDKQDKQDISVYTNE